MPRLPLHYDQTKDFKKLKFIPVKNLSSANTEKKHPFKFFNTIQFISPNQNEESSFLVRSHVGGHLTKWDPPASGIWESS